jgi:hypothetical protein
LIGGKRGGKVQLMPKNKTVCRPKQSHATACAARSSDRLPGKQGRPPTFLAWKEALFSRSEDSLPVLGQQW